MTALLDPVTDDPKPRPTPAAASLRFATVRANLMPDEILAKRQSERIRRRVILGLALLVALIVAGYGASWLQTHGARSDLESITQQNKSLTEGQQQFNGLAQIQSEVAAAKQKLATVMAGDLQWKPLLTELRAAAPTGVVLTDITSSDTLAAAQSGQNASSAATTGADPLNVSGLQPAGTLSLTGSAPSKNSVAAYADALAKIKGITSVLPTAVTTGDTGGVTFTMTATLTTAALGGRFSVKAGK